MARVRDVIAARTHAGSRFMVSGSTSAKTILAPRRAKALAVLTKVNDGMITSSPGLISSRMAAISSAEVPEVVRSALGAPVRASNASLQRRVKGPSPQILRL